MMKIPLIWFDDTSWSMSDNICPWMTPLNVGSLKGDPFGVESAALGGGPTSASILAKGASGLGSAVAPPRPAPFVRAVACAGGGAPSVDERSGLFAAVGPAPPPRMG